MSVWLRTGYDRPPGRSGGERAAALWEVRGECWEDTFSMVAPETFVVFGGLKLCSYGYGGNVVVHSSGDGRWGWGRGGAGRGGAGRGGAGEGKGWWQNPQSSG